MKYDEMTSHQLVAHWNAIKPRMPVIFQDPSADIEGLKTALSSQDNPDAKRAYLELCDFLTLKHEAKRLVSMHLPILERILRNLENRTASETRSVFLSREDFEPNPFSKDLLGHYQTWKELSREDSLYDLNEQLNISKFLHSQIAMLLFPDDGAFLSYVGKNKFEMKGELGHIAVARLNQIARNGDLSIENEAIRMLQRVETKALFQYNEEALITEVVKLLYHRQTNPGNKTVWLGTAGVINHRCESNAAANTGTISAVHLNCEEEHWSWGLNRAYLQIAAFLGFEFELLEEQYPQVKKVMMNGTPADLLIQLATCVAPHNSTTHHNQYDRGERPSASAEEYLLLKLMDYKLMNKDDRLVFKQHQEVSSPLRFRTPGPTTRRRSHSMEKEFSASTQNPSGKTPFNPFVKPLTSPEIRFQLSLKNGDIAQVPASTESNASKLTFK